METVYCTLDARRLTLCAPAGRRASGGGELVCYAVAPRRGADRKPAGKLIRLADYRPAPAEETPPLPAERLRRPRARRLSLPLLADLLASAAVVALLAVVAVQTLGL